MTLKTNLAAGAAILALATVGVLAGSASAAEPPVADHALALDPNPGGPIEERPAGALSAEALGELAGGDGGVAVAVTNQNLRAVNSGNTINAGQVISGNISLDAGALAGFSGVGNFVMNTGANNNLQSTMSVTVVMPPAG